jgi:hypothetical protein
MIRYIKSYEAGQPKQHPVGMTGYTKSPNDIMRKSPADWISEGSTGHTRDPSPYKTDPPAADGTKVSLLDTDHIWAVGGERDWVWKSFLRGHNPIWMDSYDPSSVWYRAYAIPADAGDVRRNLGHTRRFAERMNLVAMMPRSDLASTRFCLANPGVEYLVYQPTAGQRFSVKLPAGTYRYKWFNPATGATVGEGRIKASGGAPEFDAPFAGDAVLYLRDSSE